MIVPDQQFANPRLAKIYDHLDGEREDLNPYIDMVDEFNARSVLDFGCGTGVMLSQLAGRNLNLVGVDPAQASLDIAQKKTASKTVTWILGSADKIKDLHVDLAFMTGNVAQVFLTDESWLFALECLHSVLSTSGYLVFETRNSSARAWSEWTRSKTYKLTEIEHIGNVESWCEVTDVSLPYVSFNWNYVFKKDGAVLTSESTIRFREIEEIQQSLKDSGFELLEIREAPDRPGKEFVFIAKVARHRTPNR